MTAQFVVKSLESQSAANPVTFVGGQDFSDTLHGAKEFARKQTGGLRKGEGWARVDRADGSEFNLYTAHA